MSEGGERATPRKEKTPSRTSRTHLARHLAHVVPHDLARSEVVGQRVAALLRAKHVADRAGNGLAARCLGRRQALGVGQLADFFPGDRALARKDCRVRRRAQGLAQDARAGQVHDGALVGRLGVELFFGGLFFLCVRGGRGGGGGRAAGERHRREGKRRKRDAREGAPTQSKRAEKKLTRSMSFAFSSVNSSNCSFWCGSGVVVVVGRKWG